MGVAVVLPRRPPERRFAGQCHHATLGAESSLRLAPVFDGDGSVGKALAAMRTGKTEANDPDIIKLDIINPSPEAFQEYDFPA